MPLDANGVFTRLTKDTALTQALAEATAAGVTVEAGSVEEQIANWRAQSILNNDDASYVSYVQQTSPTGTNIDLQNPGFPRLAAAPASGFLKIVNNGASPQSFSTNLTFTAPNGNTYTNPTAILSVGIGETGFLSVVSGSGGIPTNGGDQNLPGQQTFSGGPAGCVITNPQPMTGGRDLESDTDYLNRIVTAATDNQSQQTTAMALAALTPEFYQASEIYANSTPDGMLVPVPIPPQGINVVILLESGVNAGPEELQAAVTILTNRFEFGSFNNQNSAIHPILVGSTFSGAFPQSYSISVAQSVITTINATIHVSFPAATTDAEKLQLSQAFATLFVQRVMNELTGAAGDYNFSFTPIDTGTPETTTIHVSASSVGPKIAPFVSVEAVRSLVSDQTLSGSASALRLLSVNILTVEFDPNAYEQTPLTLSIDAPSGGTLSQLDFVQDACFTDGTSFYDRYIFLDPSLINVSIVEAT